MMKPLLYFVTACLFVVTGSVTAAESAPDALVKSTVDEVLTAIKQTKDRQALRQLAEQKVLPHFDFKRMTQLAVGPPWKQANAAQQQALENGFRTLLVNTYTSVLSLGAAGNQTVEVRPPQSQPQQNEVVVRTLVKDPGKQPVTVDYRLEKASDGWKVYDVVVEGLSLVTNYRSSFASEINRSGIDGLIKSLAEKNRSLANV